MSIRLNDYHGSSRDTNNPGSISSVCSQQYERSTVYTELPTSCKLRQLAVKNVQLCRTVHLRWSSATIHNQSRQIKVKQHQQYKIHSVEMDSVI